MVSPWDVLVVGGGVVGAAIAREFAASGKRVLLCEKEDEVLSGASGANTGHFASFFYYTRARALLEGQLAAEARKINREWLDGQPAVPRLDTGILCLDLNPSGAQEEEEEDATGTLLSLAREAAPEEKVKRISLAEASELEPNICLAGVGGALVATNEAMVDPWLLAISHVWAAQEAGAELRTNCEVVRCKRSGNIWKVTMLQGQEQTKVEEEARLVINCAGNDGDDVEKRAGNIPKFKVKPGKGEYIVFDKRPDGSAWISRPVVPVPNKRTAGLYIFPTVYGHTVVGPTNVIQDSKTDKSVSVESQRNMLNHIYRLIPGLRGSKPLGMWAGLRPATEHADYQISFRPDKGWVTVAGIRSTGLTCSLAISRYVASTILPDHRAQPLPEMPSPVVLGDKVQIGTRIYKPSHPQTQLGLLGLPLPLPPPLSSLL